MKLYRLFFEETKRELNYLREYHDFSEKFIKDRVKELEDWVNEKASKLSLEDKDDFLEFYSNDYWELSQDFPNTVRGALLLISMSLLEYQLTDLCYSLRGTNKYPFTLNDFAGKGIVRTQIYLKKVTNVRFPDDTKYWSNILIYQIIRNALAHNNGEIKNSDDLRKVREFSKGNSSIRLDSNKVILGNTFCLEVIDNIEKFLDILYRDKEFK